MHYKKEPKRICIGVGISEELEGGTYTQMICESILPDTDEEYIEKHDEIVKNMNLIAAAPVMLETLKEIAKGQGRYDHDRLRHCANAVEDMQKLAQDMINQIEPF
jgi:hypothetical protein